MQPLKIIQTRAPDSDPVTMDEVKLHLKIDGSSEDDSIKMMIVAATTAAEQFMSRALIDRTYKLYLDHWPCTPGGNNEWWDGVREGAQVGSPARYLELPNAPLKSVTAVKVYDDSNASVIWAASNYHVDVASMPGRIALRTGGTVPLPTKSINGIEIEYIAGYGKANDVPPAIKQGILRMIAHMNEHRGDHWEASVDGLANVSGANRILGQYRIVKLI
jgi:hypothetical protein